MNKDHVRACRPRGQAGGAGGRAWGPHGGGGWRVREPRGPQAACGRVRLGRPRAACGLAIRLSPRR